MLVSTVYTSYTVGYFFAFSYHPQHICHLAKQMFTIQSNSHFRCRGLCYSRLPDYTSVVLFFTEIKYVQSTATDANLTQPC